MRMGLRFIRPATFFLFFSTFFQSSPQYFGVILFPDVQHREGGFGYLYGPDMVLF